MWLVLPFAMFCSCAVSASEPCTSDDGACAATKELPDPDSFTKLKELIFDINYGRYPEYDVSRRCGIAFGQERAEEASRLIGDPDKKSTRQWEASIFPQRFHERPPKSSPAREYIFEQCPRSMLGGRCAVLANGGARPLMIMEMTGEPLAAPTARICRCERVAPISRCVQFFSEPPEHYVDTVWKDCKPAVRP